MPPFVKGAARSAGGFLKGAVSLSGVLLRSPQIKKETYMQSSRQLQCGRPVTGDALSRRFAAC